MKNNTTEPPGRLQRRSRVISLLQPTIAPAYSPRTYRSVDDMVHELRPETPVQCLRPATITVHIHDTIDTAGLTKEDIPALKARVRDAIAPPVEASLLPKT